jgi:hypothetical protein
MPQGGVLVKSTSNLPFFKILINNLFISELTFIDTIIHEAVYEYFRLFITPSV